MSVSIKREEMTYRPDGDAYFFRDLTHWFVNRDGAAGERLKRHSAETRDIASGSTGLGALVVPQFLTEHAAGVVRAGDPFLRNITQYPLPPEGMQMTVPRSVTTGGSTAHAQTSENTDVSDTDPSLVDMTRNVVTVAGQVDLSAQAVERGGEALERFLAKDLLEAVNSNLDSQLLNGTGTNGQLLGVRNVTDVTTVTYTDTNPTAGEFLIFVSRLGHDMSLVRNLGPDTFVMHPRRWWSFMRSGGFTGFTNPFQINGYEADNDPEIPGTFGGARVILDANIPTTLGSGTNEDVIIALRADDMPVFVSPLTVKVNHSTSAGNFGVNITGFKYANWWPDRYRGTSIALLVGTGLSSPGSYTTA